MVAIGYNIDPQLITINSIVVKQVHRFQGLFQTDLDVNFS